MKLSSMFSKLNILVFIENLSIILFVFGILLIIFPETLYTAPGELSLTSHGLGAVIIVVGAVSHFLSRQLENKEKK